MNDTSHVTSCGRERELRERSRVRPLEHRHARIVANARVKLAVAHVERDHARGAALEQNVAEPARRGAEVEAVEPGRIDAERVERVRELPAGPRDVRRRLLDLERRLLVDLLAGLLVTRHEAGHHERLGLRPALGEPALDEEHVEPLARHDVRAASRATISASTEVSYGISASRSSARAAASSASSRARALADLDDVAVTVEDVVDDLEEQPELLRKGTPRRVGRLGHALPPRRRTSPRPRRARRS